jgi:hypothetical protein
MAEAEIGIFGGSGFYSFLENVEEVEVETPYGTPSAPFVVGEDGGRRQTPRPVIPAFKLQGRVLDQAVGRVRHDPVHRVLPPPPEPVEAVLAVELRPPVREGRCCPSGPTHARS